MLDLPPLALPDSARNESANKRQVAPTATEAELKKAYKTGALKHHPGE